MTTPTSPKMILWFSLLSLILLTINVGCDDESFDTRQSAVIDLSPDRFSFPATEPGGDAVERIVTVKNLGESDLVLAQISASLNHIESYQLDYRLFDIASETADAGAFFVGIDATGDSFPPNLRVPHNQAVAFKLRYVPHAEGAGGVVRMSTNAEPRELTIPIEGGVAQGDIVITPNVLDFGRVSVNESKTLNLQLTNVGSSTSLIRQVFLNASDEFEVTLNGEDAIGNTAEAPALIDPDGDGSMGISSMSSVELSVTYTPTSEVSQPGELVFAFKETIQENISVNLLANGSAPCLRVLLPDSVSDDPALLQFAPTSIDVTSTSEVIIESCGGQALEVSSITYEGDAEFTLGDESGPFNLPARGDAIPSRSLYVNFNPTQADIYEGVMVITSNDPAQPALRVPVLGRGALNACPEAVVADEEIDVQPLDIITLDASDSADLDGLNGLPVSYEWIVVERPEGSTARPVERFFNALSPADGGVDDDLSTPTAQFFVDLAGEYVFHLVVTDDLGFSAPSDRCPQAEASVMVHSIPDQDIHIELTWSTPGDPDETDNEGADVDLHFRHPNGARWNQSPYDCYFANPRPDWGVRGSLNNPTLDLDDTNGSGPENINLDDPEFTDQTTIPGPYLVGVHYYRSGGVFTQDFGGSEATVHVYLRGAMVETFTRYLNATNNFWEVAGIIWTANERRIQRVDRFYNQAPW